MALFNKNKEDKKHKGENIVGKIIYIFLLFAPLFSILTTSLYTIFNKNAYESYYGETINEEHLEYATSINVNTTYYINLAYDSRKPLYNPIDMQVSNFVDIGNSYNNLIDQTVTRIYTYNTNNYPTINIYSGTTLIQSLSTGNKPLYLSFNITSYTNNNNFTEFLQSNTLYYYTYNKYSYLDNSFDYGIYKTEQNNLFNWAKNTGTYTIMKTTTDGLEINNTFIPMLLTYWLIISIIYFIYDIALMLIWILHRKIHELTESV